MTLEELQELTFFGPTGFKEVSVTPEVRAKFRYDNGDKLGLFTHAFAAAVTGIVLIVTPEQVAKREGSVAFVALSDGSVWAPGENDGPVLVGNLDDVTLLTDNAEASEEGAADAAA